MKLDIIDKHFLKMLSDRLFSLMECIRVNFSESYFLKL